MTTVRTETAKPLSPDLSNAHLLVYVSTVLAKVVGSGTATNQNWFLVHTGRKGNELSQNENMTLIFPSVFLQIY